MELAGDVAFGQISLLVPDTVAVEGVARVGAGVLEAEDPAGTRGGVGSEELLSLPGTAGRLMIDLEVGAGLIRVYRFSPPGVQLDGGDLHLEVARVEEMEASYQVPFGRLTLDLSHLLLTSDEMVEVRIGTGELNVIVPASVNVAVSARTGLGPVDLLGRRTDHTFGEVGAERVIHEGAPTLFLDLSTGIGPINVTEGNR
ncbi:MAG: LiaF domain-containing protein [Acidimicrobiia bacterium]